MSLEAKDGKLKVNNWTTYGCFLVQFLFSRPLVSWQTAATQHCWLQMCWVFLGQARHVATPTLSSIKTIKHLKLKTNKVRFMIWLIWLMRLFVRFVAGHITGSHPRSLFQISWALITNLLLLRLEPVKFSWTHHKCNAGDSWRLKLPHASSCYKFLSQRSWELSEISKYLKVAWVPLPSMSNKNKASIFDWGNFAWECPEVVYHWEVYQLLQWVMSKWLRQIQLGVKTTNVDAHCLHIVTWC